MFLPALLELVLLIFIAIAYWQVNHKVKYLSREEDSILHKARKRAHRIVQESRDEALKLTLQAREEMRQGIKTHLDQLAIQMQNETKDGLNKLTTTAQKQIEASQQKIDVEAEKYKQQKLLEVDRQIVQILQTTAKTVLGRSLNIGEAGELVTKALEEAKKQHVFDAA